MKNAFLVQFIAILISALKPEMLRRAVDGLLDVVETAIAESETKIDDTVLLPLIELIRRTFNVPDNDEPEKAEG